MVKLFKPLKNKDFLTEIINFFQWIIFSFTLVIF